MFNSEITMAVSSSFVSRLVIIAVIIILSKLVLQVAGSMIGKLLKAKTAEEGGEVLEGRRVETLRGLIKNLLRYLVYFIAVVSILDVVGVPVTSVLAGAGIIGLAVGFGAQSLVKDVITGFFIVFEDQYAVGEFISSGSFSGIVEEMGMRVTKIRSFGGDLHIVPHGSIDTVTNHNRGQMRAMVDISIAYEEDIRNALAVLEETSLGLAGELPEIVDGPHVLGVVDLGESDVVLRVLAMTMPMQQWQIERTMRQRFKEAFVEKGIEIPYPRRVVINQGKE